MSYPLAEAHLFDWENLSLEEAWALRDRWDETRQARLDWLATTSGVELIDDPEAFAAVWRWFCRWAPAPSDLESAPDPVWWAPPIERTVPYNQRVGVEAVTTYLEQTAWTRSPDLVPAVSVYPEGRRDVVEPHQPCLDLVPDPDEGPGWPTAGMVTTIARFIAKDELETRGTRWFSKQHEGISQRIALIEKDHSARLKKKRGGHGFQIERIPREEAEELGGFQWDISFDERFGHDHHDVVAAYASALEGLDGVNEVEHYDRSMMRVAGTLGASALRAWSTKWLKENAQRR